MIGYIFWLITGLVLILIGANVLTDGSAAIARKIGISDLVVGLTIVAFGTSAPELVISAVSAAKGSTPLAIGNVVGSNIFNILAIIGVTAMVRPIIIRKSIMTNEIPMVILCSIILLVLGKSGLLYGTKLNEISRTNAILLLIFFLIFLRYTFATASESEKQPEKDNASVEESAPLPIWRGILYVILGLVALIFGGDKFVEGASGIAMGLGVSEAVIGLTIVAAGTSLPELATSVVAALKGKPELAVGNVIGSNIFNTLLVLGVAGVIVPLPFGDIGNFDLLTLLGASVAFYIFGWFFKTRTITRWEGTVLALGYVGYIAILLYQL